MSDIEEAEELDVEQEGEQEPNEPTEIEALASETGWSPEDKWRGDPDAWVTAAEFIRKGQGMLKTTLRKQDERLEELQTTMTQFKDHYSNVETKAYERAITDLKAEQRTAVEEGDTEAFDAVQGKIDDLSEDIAKPEAPKKQPAEDPNFTAWASSNAWYNSDVRLTAMADEIAPTVAKMFPELLNTPGFYERITEEVKAAHPDKFSNTRRKRPASVEGGGGGQQRKTGGNKYADLPADAKAACESFVKEGLMTADEYVATYDWD